jgi:hypothetical protein
LSGKKERHASSGVRLPKHLAGSSNSFSGTMSFNAASEMLRLRSAALSMTFFITLTTDN